MSILPTHAKSSTSSSSEAPSPNPSSDHGLLLSPALASQSSSASVSDQFPAFGSLRISAFESSCAVLDQASGLLASAAADSADSSKKVIEVGTANGKQNLPVQNTSKPTPYHSGGSRGLGYAQSKGKLSGFSVSLNGQQTSGSSMNVHGSSTNSSGRKNQMINGNHLLNFHYDSISRPQLRAPPPRRQRKIKPYNKDLFLQANYKFVVLDSGNHAPELMDPDKMLEWENIICVKYLTPHPVLCPICLEYPLCPQMTSCGHIFCFPCILRYLFMGEEDHKGDCWKKCPLCFMMVSSNDLYTIYIENVKSYCIGNTIDFMLLTRQKDSYIPSQKCRQVVDAKRGCNDEACDSFSKFTFTSDVDLSVRQAISDLDNWLVRADSGLVDDLEKLPYVCAAIEQLEQRKKYWNEHQDNKNNKADKHFDSGSQEVSLTVDAINANNEACGFACCSSPTGVDGRNKWLGNSLPQNLDEGACPFHNADTSGSLEAQESFLSSSYEGKRSLQGHSNGSRDARGKELYNFYQAIDGQHLILHPLNMKCLLNHYGGYDMLPLRIGGKILQLETVTQSEAMRRRYRYLSHFSLTTAFQLCEIDLSKILPPESLAPFMDEIKKREKQRKRLAKKEQQEKIKAEVAVANSVPIHFNSGKSSYHDPPEFNMDDFEVLGNPSATSSSPTTCGDRKLFSNVTRFGFAAAHDSPGLKIDATHSLDNTNAASDSSGATGSRNPATLSFANVISREKSVENREVPKLNEMGKKGKKPSRVLLSTAGGRRY